jgi:GxxExxY protein
MGHGVLSTLIAAQLTEHIIGLAIEVHRCTGRGLLESVYEECLCYELHRAGIQFEHQVAVPVLYKGLTMEAGFRADVVVARQVILEIKSVASLLPAHEAQLLTYLRMSQIPVGLLFYFNTSRLTDSLRRLVV